MLSSLCTGFVLRPLDEKFLFSAVLTYILSALGPSTNFGHLPYPFSERLLPKDTDLDNDYSQDRSIACLCSVQRCYQAN